MLFSLYHKIALQLSLMIDKKFFWWMALGILFLPFVVLAFFNHPSADDYCYVVNVAKTGYWQAQVDFYKNWSGRYTATFFLVSNPLVVGSFIGYQLVSITLLVFTVVSCLFFVKALLQKNRVDLPVVALSVAVLFLYLIKMPSLTEGYFWLAGALTYQLANIAVLTVWTLLINRQSSKNNKWTILVLALLCLLICGCNETSMLEFLYVLAALMVFEYASTAIIPKYYYLLLVLSLAASLVVLLAPGNEIRASYFTGNKEFVKSFTSALSASFFCLQDWLQDILIVLILCLPFLKQIESSRITSPRMITPVILLLYPFFILGILVVGYFPAFWSMGGPPPSRTLNVLYFLFLFSCLHYAVLWMTYVKQKKRILRVIPIYVQWIFIFILMVRLTPVNNFRTAVMDIISGRAWAYDREMNARYQDLYKNTGKDFTVKPITVKPKSIFLTDIEPAHPEDWKNVCMSDYFHLHLLNLSKSAE